MKISEAGLSQIMFSEGDRLVAYQDGGGVWTIGYGHTAGVKRGMKITEAQAQAYLKKDIGWAENAINTGVKVPLTQGQFDALVSFVFNLGISAFGNSTLLRKLNAGDYSGAASEFLRWNHDNGKVVAGLTSRRKREKDMFEGKGKAPEAPPVTPPSATPKASLWGMLVKIVLGIIKALF